ncbi:MAG TPA: TetR/AcrR family transcriptional regulator [Galbitalea sp.]
METKTVRGTARRAAILEATSRVICERGVEGTRLSDVAEAADVSIGSIQHHFQTRDDLLTSTFEWVNDAFLNDWEATGSEADARRKVHALIRFAAFAQPGSEPTAWSVWIEFWALAHRNSVFRVQYEHIYSRWRAPFFKAIEEGVGQGVFRCFPSVQDVVDRLTAEIEGLRVRTLLDPEGMPRERMFSLLISDAEHALDARLSP